MRWPTVTRPLSGAPGGTRPWASPLGALAHGCRVPRSLPGGQTNGSRRHTSAWPLSLLRAHFLATSRAVDLRECLLYPAVLLDIDLAAGKPPIEDLFGRVRLVPV
jgi:hypothetical protein